MSIYDDLKYYDPEQHAKELADKYSDFDAVPEHERFQLEAFAEGLYSAIGMPERLTDEVHTSDRSSLAGVIYEVCLTPEDEWDALHLLRLIVHHAKANAGDEKAQELFNWAREPHGMSGALDYIRERFWQNTGKQPI